MKNISDRFGRDLKRLPTVISRAAERGGGGGGGGGIAPGPEVLGASEIFLLGPSLFCVLNISAQRTSYLGFFS
jgi:hypothetical protein